jgi:uncharacterized protein YdeI (BOF family)
MNITRRHILPVILGGVAILSTITSVTATAGSKDGKKSGAYSSAAAAAEVMVSTPETASRSTADRSDHKPGPAWKTIGGTVKHIKGDVYTIEDYEGNQVHLYVSRETKQLRGNKQVGDRVRAEITHGRFANSIQ